MHNIRINWHIILKWAMFPRAVNLQIKITLKDVTIPLQQTIYIHKVNGRLKPERMF